MKTVEMIDAVELKIGEMEFNLKQLLNSDVSENTKRTQKFQRTKDIRAMIILNTVLHQASDEIGLNEEVQKWFTSMVTLTSERKAKYTVEVHKGDSVLELLEKYKEVKDIYNKIMSAVKEQGLTVDYSVPGGVLR